jgi:hypothetical protein
MVKHDKSRFNASQSARKARSGELAKLWAGDVAFGGQGSEEQSGELTLGLCTLVLVRAILHGMAASFQL